MSTPFQTALLALIAAEREHNYWMHEDEAPEGKTDATERALAQAGDVLEAELRKMMREECGPAAPFLPFAGRAKPFVGGLEMEPDGQP